jgi:ribosomal protein S18 acetylase RimI-like enzyme
MALGNPNARMPYTIVALPKVLADTSDYHILVNRTKEFRLKSLQISPGSYGSTYEQEVEKDIDFWINRLSNPQALHFVALRQDVPVETSDEDFLEKEWLGWIVRLGPQSGLASSSLNISPWKVLGQESDRLQTQNDTLPVCHFLINGMFVTPEARGLGLGRALIEVALKSAEEATSSQGSPMMTCSLVVDKDNPSAVALYLKSGFKTVKEEMFRPDIGRHRPALTMDLARPVATGATGTVKS